MSEALSDFDFDAAFDAFRRRLKDNVREAMVDIALRVQRDAIKNAPRSPTAARIKKAQKERWEAKGKKPTKKQRDAWRARRNPRSVSRPKPGGLERSIEAETVDWNTAHVFVAKDSEASEYAYKIHEEKGVSWRNRGLGTQAKGARADDKFIERARDDNEEYMTKQLQKAIEKAIKET